MQPYAVNGLNQITSDSEKSYVYDLNGNLIQKSDGGTTTLYRYDALNRLMVVEEPSHWQVTYSYDSFGRRLTRNLCTWIDQWVPQESLSYLYQGQKEIGAYRGDQVTQLRVLGHGKGAELGAAIAIELEGRIFAPLHDHRGNVCCLMDNATGQVSEGYRYTAFGERSLYDQYGQMLDQPSIGNPWYFASKRLDPHTGLFQFGKRDYDSNLGRWLTPDPMGFVDGPNLYAYVHNSPLTLFDPWGLEATLYDRNRAGATAGASIGCRSARRDDSDRSCGDRSTSSAEPSGNRTVYHNYSNSPDYGMSRVNDAVWSYRGFKSSWSQWNEYERMTFCLECLNESSNMMCTAALAFPVLRLVAAPVRVTTGLALKALRQAPRTEARPPSSPGTLTTNRPLMKVEEGTPQPPGVSVKSQEVVHVTPQGVALPAGVKYEIPKNYIENKDRFGSYGEIVNGKFQERLRIDPATPPGAKGPNYSHYHRNAKSKHYSPRPEDPNPGFDP